MPNCSHLQNYYQTMALRSLSLLFVFSIAFSFIPSSHPLPYIVLHGLGSGCSSPENTAMLFRLTFLFGIEGHCMYASVRSIREVGNGLYDSWFMPIHKQVEEICQKVKENEMLRDGYNIVGISQGNIIARGVIELCDGGPPVKNYISLAGPHAGVASIPACRPRPLCIRVAEIIKSSIYTDFVQKSLAPSNYVKIPDDIQDYLKKCSFLPLLNNEYPDRKNATYKERLSSLENLVLIMFKSESILIPKETSWFGYYADGGFKTVLSPNQTKLYIEDWIGLRSMDEKGKVKFISVEGDHVEISDMDIKTYVVPYLKGTASSTKSRNSKLGS